MADPQIAGAPSPWVMRHAARIRPAGIVLDLACGSGRHALWFAGRGFTVEAVDRDEVAISSLTGSPGIQARLADLENAPWPYAEHRFDGIVVSRYLHRPLLPLIAEALEPGGVLIYETFMIGNERFGKPSNPDFLLRPDELLMLFGACLSVISFEQGEERFPKPSVMQRICAIREIGKNK